MYTKQFFSVLLFLSTFLNSQTKYNTQTNLQIEYKATYSNAVTIIKKGILIPYPSSNKSNYYEFNKNKTFDNNQDNNEETKETLIVGDLDFVERNFIDYDKNELTSIEMINFDKKIYQIQEKLSKLNWKLNYKETLKVGDYLCYKATVYFRGRNYIAWYSNEFPLTFGPWKFNGLPGLIFKVYDDTYRYDWTIKKIGKKNIDEDFLNKNKPNVTLTFKDFVTSKYNLYSDKMNRLKNNITTRQERGTKVTFKPGNIRNGQEIVFEWEEEIEEK